MAGLSSGRSAAWMPPWAFAELQAWSVVFVATPTLAPAWTAETAAASPAATGYGCVVCHNATVSGDRAILSPAGYLHHVDGNKDVAFPVRGIMTSGAYGSPTCANNYCHSSGRPLTTGSATAFEYKTVAWNQAATLDCKGCHGAVSPGAFTSQFGEPNYATGGANAPPRRTTSGRSSRRRSRAKK